MNNPDFIELSKIFPDVSRETFNNLCLYESLLRKWQSGINLISSSTLDNLWKRHILDSAQLFPLYPDAERWLDLGSGGGFPGIVIAIFLKERNGHIDLIESNGKKTAFLRTVISMLSLPATVYHMRIENSCNIFCPDIITARALASLKKTFHFIYPLINEKTVSLIQKGQGYFQEITEASEKWHFDFIKHKSMIDKNSVILEIHHLHTVSREYVKDR